MPQTKYDEIKEPHGTQVPKDKIRWKWDQELEQQDFASSKSRQGRLAGCSWGVQTMWFGILDEELNEGEATPRRWSERKYINLSEYNYF